jgi:predicted RNase H-like HicB family nuclease
MKHISAGGTVKMGHLIVVRATWDSETHVWTAESPDLPGLVTEASSLDELDAKLPDLIRDLLEDDKDDMDGGYDVPVEVIATFSKRIRIGAAEAA